MYDVDMKFETVTKLDKRNTTTLKKLSMTSVSNFDVTVLFSIYGQLAVLQKPDFGGMVYTTYIFINNMFLSYKN